MLACVKTKPRSFSWQEAMSSSTWNSTAFPGIRWSPQHRGPLIVHGFVPSVQPRNCLLPGSLENEKLLASGMFFWSLSPQGERSLGWKTRGQVYPTQQGVRQPWGTFHQVPQNSWGFFSSAWYLPSKNGGLPAPLHSWHKAEISLQSSLQAGDYADPQKYSPFLLLSTVALRLQLMRGRESHKMKCAPVLKMSHSNNVRRGKNIYIFTCSQYIKWILHASHFTYIISFNHHYNYFSHFKDVQTENDSKLTADYFLSLIEGILWNPGPCTWESVTRAQYERDVLRSYTGSVLALVTSAHCLRLCDILPCVSLLESGILSDPQTQLSSTKKRKQFEFYKKSLKLGVWVHLLVSQLYYLMYVRSCLGFVICEVGIIMIDFLFRVCDD